MAKALGARVVFLTVLQHPTFGADYPALLEEIAQIAAAGERNAARQLATLQDQLQSAGITAETVQVFGAPITHILEQAKALTADYIVMGSHGHTALYDVFIGSTTHGVLSKSPCPVLIVPAAKRADHPRGAVRVG